MQRDAEIPSWSVLVQVQMALVQMGLVQVQMELVQLGVVQWGKSKWGWTVTCWSLGSLSYDFIKSTLGGVCKAKETPQIKLQQTWKWLLGENYEFSC